jgi:hypothetical protein
MYQKFVEKLTAEKTLNYECILDQNVCDGA